MGDRDTALVARAAGIAPAAIPAWPCDRQYAEREALQGRRDQWLAVASRRGRSQRARRGDRRLSVGRPQARASVARFRAAVEWQRSAGAAGVRGFLPRLPRRHAGRIERGRLRYLMPRGARAKEFTPEELAMPITTTRRQLLAGSAAALALP